MLAITKSMALQGLSGYLVSIQVDISSGLPCFEIVGLPDTSVKESKERVKTAIKNSNVEFLSRKIIVNLAPADTKKEGSIFDLPIAIGILIANNTIKINSSNNTLENTIFIGELSLDGTLEKASGILPICIEARRLGIKRIVLPKPNLEEASIIQDLEIIPINNLEEAIAYLNGNLQIEKFLTNSSNLPKHINYNFDFQNVKGQENVKRALEISAAGGHNCLLIRASRFGKNFTCAQPTEHPT